MNILIIGDIVGAPGRKAVKMLYPQIQNKYNIDFFIANCENAAGGSGLTKKTGEGLWDSGIDVITTGDHVWRNQGIMDIISEDRIVRPANLPVSNPGKGAVIYNFGKDLKIGVINILGRTFMQPVECPFAAVKQKIEQLKKETNIIIVDFHAEATSEKIAMGWYLDGEVSAVVGTHTHVQTADETVLPEGTAYITDLGMTGPHLSVIGRDIDAVLHKFVHNMPKRFDVAEDDIRMNGVVVNVDEKTGKAVSIKRIQEKYTS